MELEGSNLPDFAFGISANFRWEAADIPVGENTIRSSLVYPAHDSTFHQNLLAVQNEALKFFSDSFPGVPYPYESFTTFLGVTEYDGMEFPMMANNGSDYREGLSYNLNHTVTAHEIAHSYLPFYVGINEIKDSWMEEGLAFFLEAQFIDSRNKNTNWQELVSSLYSRTAGYRWDAPLFTQSNTLIYSYTHSFHAYYKPAVMFFVLQDLLGKKTFTNCWQSFINRWSSKHPSPFDLMYTFNHVSGQNLDWFWKTWIFDWGVADVEVAKINDQVVLRNVGKLAVPVDLILIKEDNSTKQVHFKSDI